MTDYKEGGRYAVGSTVRISLRSNPSTGYTWKIVDGGGLSVKDEYVPDSREGTICGAGGTQYYFVTADKPGTYVFVARYARPWEKEAEDPAEFELVFE